MKKKEEVVPVQVTNVNEYEKLIKNLNALKTAVNSALNKFNIDDDISDQISRSKRKKKFQEQKRKFVFHVEDFIDRFIEEDALETLQEMEEKPNEDFMVFEPNYNDFDYVSENHPDFAKQALQILQKTKIELLELLKKTKVEIPVEKKN